MMGLFGFIIVAAIHLPLSPLGGSHCEAHSSSTCRLMFHLQSTFSLTDTSQIISSEHESTDQPS